MGMVALRRGIGSAFVVISGQYGDVRRFAQEHGISRQWVYREAKQVTVTLEGTQTRQEIDRLKTEVAQLRQQVTQRQAQLAQAVVLDDDKQAEVACVGQACGVTLPQCRALLEVLIAKPLSVASLGRRTQPALRALKTLGVSQPQASIQRWAWSWGDRVSPVGTIDNSPPLQQWVRWRRQRESPVGTTERGCVSRPYGTTSQHIGDQATAEAVGY
jgi:hypothetical protein